MSTNIHRYFDTQFQCQAVKILPGEFFATAQPLLLVTVLGSCVAACLRDATNGVVGMNHFLLPDRAQQHASHQAAHIARYGADAMDVLIEAMARLGAQHHRIEAKLFGGAKMLPIFKDDAHIGLRNAEFAQYYLKQRNIPLRSYDLLGKQSRKIYFFGADGQVLLKNITHQETNH